MDADVVMFLYRPEAEDISSNVEVIVAKHRNGPIGTVNLAFKPSLAKFENATRER